MPVSRSIPCGLFALASALSLGFATAAHAQPFTYNGLLRTASLPATGAFDVEFRVFNAATAGSQVGATSSALNVAITDGVFTATVSPGTGVFTGPDRWLEIAVRTAGSGTYTTLSPRQKLEAAPYAARSLSERLTDNGTGGLVNDSTRVQRLLWNTASPITGSDYFTLRTPATAANFGGMYTDTASADGYPFYGFATAGTFRSYVYQQGSSGPLIVNNQGNRVFITSAGLVGVGTAPTGSERLQVEGAVRATGAVTAQSLTTTGPTTASDFAYTAPQTRSVTIHPASFVSGNPGQTAQYSDSAFIAYFDAAVGSGVLCAPISLPDGAVITGYKVWLSDASASSALETAVQVRSLSGGTPFVYGFSSSSGSSGAATLVTGTLTTPLTVNNATDLYAFTVYSSDWVGGNHGVKSAQVFYTVPAPR